MQPTEIQDAHVNIAENQDEFLTLPVRISEIDLATPDGPIRTVVLQSAWKPSPEELQMLIGGGYVVLSVVSTQHPPVMIDVEVPEPR